MEYVVSFLAVAFFPLALAAYGVYLAATTLDGKTKAWAFVIIGFLTSLGILTGALEQIRIYHSDVVRDSRESTVQSKLDTSIRQEAYVRGQLDSLSLMVGKLGEKSADPAVKQVAEAIAKIANSNTLPPDFLRQEVVALIRDLRMFQSERRQIEDAVNGTAQAGPVGAESIRTFQQRFSKRLRTLAAELPQYLSRESRFLGEIAETPLGGNSGFIDGLLEVLRSVTASL